MGSERNQKVDKQIIYGYTTFLNKSYYCMLELVNTHGYVRLLDKKTYSVLASMSVMYYHNTVNIDHFYVDKNVIYLKPFLVITLLCYSTTLLNNNLSNIRLNTDDHMIKDMALENGFSRQQHGNTIIYDKHIVLDYNCFLDRTSQIYEEHKTTFWYRLKQFFSLESRS
ncbi:hypothetical protein TetV_131 [Tetraselmis virus 1]|uniref:Uncharacterized protein n=1 Tax=Tetraselmis virus 1 TaxID=2060617 RepID=A0A2P0VMW4_9VIRU|nr:hypothetical protein QJ968_gp131 [Tetraselmis virus 1]AUF82223.1 hypothetical protein TetV_131 [Tetraselmis virus 1]